MHLSRRAFVKSLSGIWVPSLMFPRRALAQIGGNISYGGNVSIGGNAAPVSVVTEVADNFNSDSSGNLSGQTTSTGGYAWASQTGDSSTMTVASGIVTDASVASNGSCYYVNHTMSSANYTAQVDCTYPNHTDGTELAIGVRFDSSRSIGSGTMYMLCWRPDLQTARIYRVVTGTITEAPTGGGYTNGSGLSVPNLAYTLKIVLTSTTVSCYMSGTLVGTWTDNTISAAGNVCMGSGCRNAQLGNNKATYDNLVVTVP